MIPIMHWLCTWSCASGCHSPKAARHEEHLSHTIWVVGPWKRSLGKDDGIAKGLRWSLWKIYVIYRIPYKISIQNHSFRPCQIPMINSSLSFYCWMRRIQKKYVEQSNNKYQKESVGLEVQRPNYGQLWKDVISELFE